MGNNQPTMAKSNDLNQNVNTIQNPGVQPNIMSQNMV